MWKLHVGDSSKHLEKQLWYCSKLSFIVIRCCYHKWFGSVSGGICCFSVWWISPCSWLLLHSCISVPHRRHKKCELNEKNISRDKKKLDYILKLPCWISYAILCAYMWLNWKDNIREPPFFNEKTWGFNVLHPHAHKSDHIISSPLYNPGLSQLCFPSKQSKNAINIMLISQLKAGIFSVYQVQVTMVKHISIFPLLPLSLCDAARCTSCVWQTSLP